MNYLILLDRKFPFKSGEAFIENEIDEISQHFDKILIFPSDVAINSHTTRKIKSKNVEVNLVEKYDYKVRKYEYLLKSIFGKRFINNHKKLGFRNFMEEKFFYTAVKQQSKKIIDKLQEIQYDENDYIYIYSYWLYINAGVAIEIAKYLDNNNIKHKIISRAHRFDIYEEGRYLPAREYLLKNIDLVYACSDNGADYLKEKYEQYKEKIKTSYLGTYDHGIGKCSEDGVFRIVSCSRVSKVKRVDLIIEALALLENDLKIKWTHIGSGDFFDKIKEKAIKKLHKNIEFEFLGAISNTEVYNYYLNNPVDLFINVSLSEGLPVSIMEAISFGVPVIATNVGGTSEIVNNQINGYLLDNKLKIDELAKKILEIYKMNESEYMFLRKNSREVWLNRFQAAKNYSTFIKSFKEF